MDKYHVKILERAIKNIDEIYLYITNELLEPNIAENKINEFEKAILSLEEMPYRFSTRKTGKFANQGYRQLFVGNFTVVFRINRDKKEVLVVTVKYSKSEFW